MLYTKSKLQSFLASGEGDFLVFLNKVSSIVLELFPGQANLIKGNNSTSKQNRVMVLVQCTSSQYPLSLYELLTKSLG